MNSEKWQNKEHLRTKQYVQSGISENTDLKKVIIQKESINLIATNGTFITKGDIERTF